MGTCSERLEESTRALASLEQQFHTLVGHLESQVPRHPCFWSVQVEQLQRKVLSQLLVRMATLQAQTRLRLEGLSRYVQVIQSFVLISMATYFSLRKSK